jgi:glycosyltransferase involved in cell wall biosynthesis
MAVPAELTRPERHAPARGERVTIFVPTFNRARWLPRAIESALAQTVEDFVLIVSDNCSTDDTREVVAGFDDPRLVYVRQDEHVGLNEHFNRCYAMAATEYMFLIPDDDVMLPDALERTMAVLDANPSVGLVHGCAKLIDENDDTIAPAHHMTQLDADEIEPGQTFIALAVDHGYRVHASTALLRTRAFADISLRDEEFPVTDVGLWLRLALNWDLAFVARTLAVVRVHSGAYTADGRGVTTGGYVQQLDVIDKLREVKLAFVEEFADRLRNPDDLRSAARAAYRRDLLDFAGHATIPERRFWKTVRTLASLVRKEPALLGEARAWRLLGASVLGRKAVERIKNSETRAAGRVAA